MRVLTVIAEIALAYAALAITIGVLAGAIRRRDARLGTVVAVAPLALLPLLFPLRLVFVYELVLLGWTLLAARLLMRQPSDAALAAAGTKTASVQLMLLTASAIFLVPLFWLLLTSLKTDQQLAAIPPPLLPHPADWRNYPAALKMLPPESRDGLTNVGNTLTIAILSVIGTVLSSSLVAYAFARMRWPGKDVLFGLVLATMMMPDAVTMMPRFLIFQHLGWYDTLKPLWVPAFFGSAFNIFLLRQFFMGIPTELEDAAKIDGCGYLATWWRVMMPMVKPALVSVALLTFIASWKEFLNPLIYISSPEKMPVSYVLQLFSTAHNDHPGMLMAATAMVILPIMLLFFFAQRYFVEGISLTGLGGR